MVELSIALVLIAAMAFYLVNKFLDLKYQISNTSADADTIAALTERINKFDQRINDTWSNTSNIKQELDAFKLAIGIRKT